MGSSVKGVGSNDRKILLDLVEVYSPENIRHFEGPYIC